MLVLLILIYFGAGLVFIMAFDIATHNVRNKLNSVALENQVESMGVGMPVPYKVARLLTLVFLWIRWPELAVSLVINKIKQEAVKK